jgi:thiamine pyrophosphate-dependent acetolactate synthase large subunit-like protein
MTTSSALAALNKALPTARMVAVDGGRFSAAAIDHLTVPDARSWTASFAGFGAIGNAVSTSIGMCCAQPDMTGIAVVGDGGFMLGGLAEFNTAVRYGLDLIVVVINDRCYGAELRKLEQRGFNPDLSMFDWPDLAAAATALGGTGIRVAELHDLGRMKDALRDRKSPVLVEITVDASSQA